MIMNLAFEISAPATSRTSARLLDSTKSTLNQAIQVQRHHSRPNDSLFLFVVHPMASSSLTRPMATARPSFLFQTG